MDLRHNQLPWNDQIWAKINADLAQALAQSRRVRAPFEVFHVPSSTQTVMADRREVGPGAQYLFTETETTPIIELAIPFEIAQSQVHNEGDNFYALDRIIAAAYELGYAEDELIMWGDAEKARDITSATVTRTRKKSRGEGVTRIEKEVPWEGLRIIAGWDSDPTIEWPENPNDLDIGRTGLELFNAVTAARTLLRFDRRHEPYALILGEQLESAISSTVYRSNSLNTPIERLRPLVTAGIFSTPALQPREAYVVSVARSWIDIAQALEPSIQFLSVGAGGEYKMRLVERFAFRLKDKAARRRILMRNEVNNGAVALPLQVEVVTNPVNVNVVNDRAINDGPIPPDGTVPP